MLPSTEKFAGKRHQSEVCPAHSNDSVRYVCGRGTEDERGEREKGTRQTFKFHMAPRVCVTSFHLPPRTYLLTHVDHVSMYM